jgi:predicted dienelactone hydrolase
MRHLLPLILAACYLTPLSVADDKSKSKDGPLAVEVADDLTLQDPIGKKNLLCKVYYPKTGGPYPVILFSHGFGGNKDSFAPIATHWASHGYVVIHPSHHDGIGRPRNDARNAGNDNPIVRGRPEGLLGAGGLLGALNDPGKISVRIADLVLIMDKLEELPNLVPGLNGKIDTQSIGVAGHSFGAYTAMLLGGVKADLGQEKGKTFLDTRVKCILPISGQGTGQQGLTDKSWESLSLPMMTITGTRDQGAGGQGVEWKKEPYNYSPTGDKYLVVIDGANHVSFGGGLGIRGNGITDIVKLCTTHYWDAYLKKSEAAKEYLRSEKIVKDAAGRCTVENK